MSKTSRIISSGVVTFRFIENKGFEVLLLKYSTFYSHPKGRIEKNEEIKKTALRELFEETNLSPKIISSKPVSIINYQYTSFGRDINKKVYFFAGLVNKNDQVRTSFEHSAYQWLDIHSALDMLVYETDRQALQLCYKWISNINRDMITKN